MKNTIIVFLVLVALGIGGYMYIKNKDNVPEKVVVNDTQTTTATTTKPVATSTQEANKVVLGMSASKNEVAAYTYGTGTDEILFVGGIHGGYEWNTSLVAYQLMDYLKDNPNVVPKNVKVTVIPVMNPDGLEKVTGKTGRFTAVDVSTDEAVLTSGRFNGNTVDLNRNFDCDWKSEALWQTKKVSGGTAVFSEPESQAVRAYIEGKTPKAVVVWYSSAGGVFASNCHGGVSVKTDAIMKAFAKASGYPAHASFDFYATTGDMANWLAKKDIAAISVLLTNHTDTEWSKNKAGVDALLKYYAK